MLADDEVRGVLAGVALALSIVAALQCLGFFGAGGGYDALGLLAGGCGGPPPSAVVAGVPTDVCLTIENGRGEPASYLVLFKVVEDPGMLPGREEPSPAAPLAEWRVDLPPHSNTTLEVNVTVPQDAAGGGRAALVFELWREGEGGSMEYTGVWVHAWVRVEVVGGVGG